VEFSKFNIFSRIKDSGNYFILNLLSGNADLLSPGEALQLESLRKGEATVEQDFQAELEAKGYWVKPEEELKLYNRKYLDFLDTRDEDEVQLFFVPNYSCNFACSYCYQDAYVNKGPALTQELIEAFFAYVRANFSDRSKYLTLFGGEPLLDAPRQKEHIASFMQKAGEAGLEVCVVTNGYTLVSYIDILKSARIREIQVTLDGTEEVHNKRRFLKGGGKTFDKVVAGIDACLANRLPVNLRMVADKENLDDLPALARFAKEKGWTGNPYFKTQIGRNYELHHCQSSPEKLFDRVSLYEKLYQLTQEHPEILGFYKPAYSVTRFLAENGNLPDPLFDSCPACKTEWAFDYTGQIYSCTATVGKQDESLGTFYPRVYKNEPRISEWEMRDVTTIPGCRDCNLQLACGGGCGSVARNQSGKIGSADCRPVRELLELGFSAYSGDLSSL